MGEALRLGRYFDFINLTASPGYAALLGFGQWVLQTNRDDEILRLKLINFLSIIVAMGSFDYFLSKLKSNLASFSREIAQPLPGYLISAILYSVFLFSLFEWIRPRLMAPEMAVMSLLFTCVAAILKIRRDPEQYGGYILLGVFSGLCYLFKAFYLPFSLFLYATAFLAAGSRTKHIPRIAVSAAIMVMLVLPWAAALKWKFGVFTFGEAGTLNYGIYVKSKGEPINRPKVLLQGPRVLSYDHELFQNATRPATFDPGFWKIGIKPVFDFGPPLKNLVRHLSEIISDQPWFSIAFLFWYIFVLGIGSVKFGPLRPLSIPLCLALPGLAGIAMYSIIHVEMRYISPFLVLVPGALVTSLRTENPESKRIAQSSFIFAATILILVVFSAWGQSARSLYSVPGKPSFYKSYSQTATLNQQLREWGVASGSHLAVIGLPPVYWARIGGYRIIGEIPDVDEFLAVEVESRWNVIENLRKMGIRAIISKDERFSGLASEGWKPILGVDDFFVFLL